MSRILELCFITGEACFYNSAEHYIIYAKTQARAASQAAAVYTKTAFRKQLFYFRLHSRCKILIKGTVWRIQFSGFIWRPPGESLQRAFSDRKLESLPSVPSEVNAPRPRRGTTSAAANRWMEIPFRTLSSVCICVPNLFSYCSQQVKLNQKARKVSTGFCWTLKPKNLLCGMESLFVILDTGEKGDDYERDAGNVHVCVR